jgi:hypothetical protein
MLNVSLHQFLYKYVRTFFCVSQSNINRNFSSTYFFIIDNQFLIFEFFSSIKIDEWSNFFKIIRFKITIKFNMFCTVSINTLNDSDYSCSCFSDFYSFSISLNCFFIFKYLTSSLVFSFINILYSSLNRIFFS